MSVALLFATGLAAQTEKPPQIQDGKALIASMRERSKVLKAADLEMVTRGSYPGGVRFEVSGRVRVLAKGQADRDPGQGPAYRHIRMVSKFLDGSSGLGEGDSAGPTTTYEMVKTPDGVWTRESGPEGQVFTKMGKKLMAELDRAAAALRAAEGLPSAVGEGSEPLGADLVESLGEQFDLAFTPATEGGVAGYRLSGPARLEPESPVDTGGAVRAELFVRASDLSLQTMRQWDDDDELVVAMEVRRLVLDGNLTPESFALKLPKGYQFVDVMDHPPSRAQIEQMRQDYEDLLAEQKRAADEAAAEAKKKADGDQDK